jgi:hypothetical protein
MIDIKARLKPGTNDCCGLRSDVLILGMAGKHDIEKYKKLGINGKLFACHRDRPVLDVYTS